MISANDLKQITILGKLQAIKEVLDSIGLPDNETARDAVVSLKKTATKAVCVMWDATDKYLKEV